MLGMAQTTGWRHVLLAAPRSPAAPRHGLEGHLGGADGDGEPPTDGAAPVGRLGGGFPADGGGV